MVSLVLFKMNFCGVILIYEIDAKLKEIYSKLPAADFAFLALSKSYVDATEVAKAALQSPSQVVLGTEPGLQKLRFAPEQNSSFVAAAPTLRWGSTASLF